MWSLEACHVVVGGGLAESCRALQPNGLCLARLLCPGKNTEVGCHALLQGIFPTQGSNPHLLGLCIGQGEGFSPLIPPGKPSARNIVSQKLRKMSLNVLTQFSKRIFFKLNDLNSLFNCLPYSIFIYI